MLPSTSCNHLHRPILIPVNAFANRPERVISVAVTYYVWDRKNPAGAGFVRITPAGLPKDLAPNGHPIRFTPVKIATGPISFEDLVEVRHEAHVCIHVPVQPQS